MQLWQKDKKAYRARYYENGPSFENPETIFGKKIAKMLEDGDKHPILDRVPRYQYKEFRIELEVGGVKFLGVLDSFSKRRKRILEYKTGKIPWTKGRTESHDQLVVYSLLVKEKFDIVDPYLRLVWIPTRNRMIVDKVGSQEMEGESREIELVDIRPLIFRRRVSERQRQEMKRAIVQCAKEISEDYKIYIDKSAKEYK